MEKVNKAIEASPFEAIRKWDENGHEYWSARALARILGYTRRGDFNEAIGKAQATCHISGLPVEDHFLVVSEVQELSNGSKRKYADLHLSRYACYLCIMSADPSKEAVRPGAGLYGGTYLSGRSPEAHCLPKAKGRGGEAGFPTQRIVTP